MTLYGLSEIAEALGVKVEKVRDWREAGHLPEPTAKLRAGYVWVGEDIEWWIEEHRPRCSECEGYGILGSEFTCPKCDGTGVEKHHRAKGEEQ